MDAVLFSDEICLNINVIIRHTLSRANVERKGWEMSETDWLLNIEQGICDEQKIGTFEADRVIV